LDDLFLKGLMAEIEKELDNLTELRKEMKMVKGEDSIIRTPPQAAFTG
jgi:hypothetical protein